MAEELDPGIKELTRNFKKIADSAGKSFARNFGKSVRKEMEDISTTVKYKTKFDGKAGKKGVDDQVRYIRSAYSKTVTDIKKELSSLGGMSKGIKSVTSGLSSFGSVFSALKSGNLGQLNGAMKEATSHGRGLLKTSTAASKLGGKFKLLGKTSGALGKTLMKFAGPAGWAMMAFGALKKVFDLSMTADKFVKDLNSSFARIKGPSIVSGDSERQFEEFNSSINDLADNIRLGLDYKEVGAFYDALSQGGVQITSMAQEANSYRTAIDVARRGQILMGTELNETSSWMANMMVDLNMDLQEVDDSFTQMSFGASKAGITTNRFWQAVEGASTELSMYGNFIGAAAKNMEAFSKTATSGAKESAQATRDLGQSFKDLPLQKAAATIRFARDGGWDSDAFLDKQSKKWQGKADKTGSRVDRLRRKKEEATDPSEKKTLGIEIEKLLNEQAASLAKAAELLGLKGKGEVALAGYIENFTPAAFDMFSSTIKKVTTTPLSNIAEKGKEQLQVLFKLLDVTGASKHVLIKTLKDGLATKKRLKLMLDGITAGNVTSDKIKKLGEANSPGEIKAALTDLGVNEGEYLDDLVASMSDDGETKDAISNVFKEMVKGGMATNETLGKASDKLMSAAHKEGALGDPQEQKDTGRIVADEIVDLTTSNQKLLDITKDAARFRFNNIKLLRGISGSVFSIARDMLDGKKTEEQKQFLSEYESRYGEEKGERKLVLKVGGEDVSYGEGFDHLNNLLNSVRSKEVEIKDLTDKNRSADKDSSEYLDRSDKITKLAEGLSAGMAEVDLFKGTLDPTQLAYFNKDRKRASGAQSSSPRRSWLSSGSAETTGRPILREGGDLEKKKSSGELRKELLSKNRAELRASQKRDRDRVMNWFGSLFTGNKEGSASLIPENTGASNSSITKDDHSSQTFIFHGTGQETIQTIQKIVNKDKEKTPGT